MKHSIGAVSFRLIGLPYDPNPPLGQLRVDLLRAFYRHKPTAPYEPYLPEGARLVTQEEINWDTAGPRVTSP